MLKHVVWNTIRIKQDHSPRKSIEKYPHSMRWKVAVSQNNVYKSEVHFHVFFLISFPILSLRTLSDEAQG